METAKGTTSGSIRTRFIALMATVLLGSTVVLSLVIGAWDLRVLEHALETEGMSVAALVARMSQDHLVSKNTIQLDAIVHEAKDHRDILYAVISDAEGNLMTTRFASVDIPDPRIKPLLQELPRTSELPDLIAAIKRSEPILEISVPVEIFGKQTGSVTLGLSKGAIHRQVLVMMLAVFGLNMVAAVVLGLVLYVFTQRAVLAPVTMLADAANRLAKGNLFTRVQGSAQGEIGQLVDSFNRMAEDLEKTTVSRNYMDEIISSMRDALIVATPAGRITRINVAAGFLLGYDESELLGQHISKVIAEEPGNENRTVTTVLNDSSVSAVEKTCLTKKGETVPVLFSASVMRNADGQLLGIVCVAQNIMALKKAEQKLKTYSDELTMINEELKSFAYIVSHDLRAPLVNIRGFSEELIHGIRELGPLLKRYLDGFDPAEQEKFRQVLDKDIPEAVNYIGSSVKRMDNLITSILKLSRAGRRTLNPEPLSTQQIVQDILRTLTHQIETGGVRVEVHGLPDLVADRTVLEQIFGNLIDNAIKYLEPGRAGEIAVTAETGEGEISFHIRDNGRGIAAEDIPKAFEIFRRVGRQDVPGEGMGLAYVKTLVRLLGGRIWCTSSPGEGSMFSFTIPLNAAQEPSQPEAS